MNRSMLLLAALASAACATAPRTAAPPPALAESLVGTWQVDLRPAPDAPPSFQELVITAVEGQAFTGTFYGAPVSQARVNAAWGAVRLAFVTADGSGAYHHAAVLRGSRLEGMTNSTGRDFLAVWSAERR